MAKANLLPQNLKFVAKSNFLEKKKKNRESGYFFCEKMLCFAMHILYCDEMNFVAKSKFLRPNVNLWQKVILAIKRCLLLNNY